MVIGLGRWVHSKMRKLRLLLLSNTMVMDRMVRKLLLVLLSLLGLLIINGRLMVTKLMMHRILVLDIVNSCNISSSSLFARYVRIFVR